MVPEYTKHCFMCEHCVIGFDHHCQWLMKCIGYKNHRLFIIFLYMSCMESLLFVIATLSCEFTMCIYVRTCVTYIYNKNYVLKKVYITYIMAHKRYHLTCIISFMQFLTSRSYDLTCVLALYLKFP